MGANSKIEWTDHTFNPWWGCVRVSPACEHCYAETFDKRVHGVGKGHWGPKSERRFFGDKHWSEPRKWNQKAEKTRSRRRVFCASMADVFEDRDVLDEHRERLWDLIITTPWLDWLLLTKRPENFERFLPDGWFPGDGFIRKPLPNVWLGVTAENQEWADRRLPILLRTPAQVRFVSAEPLLGPVLLPRGLDWVIVGGESGPGARPMNVQWVRHLRDQCLASGAAFHFKQWGAHDINLVRLGKKKTGRELDGRTWDEFPTGRLDGPEVPPRLNRRNRT